ncbi:MAG: nicotinate (nicotinamide) nucleotide adenylyltransferase [Planctomycetota bacterium]
MGNPARTRLGLFGGSFDPVHVGHLHAASAAREAFDLSRIVFVPARQSPFKPGRQLAPGADRVEMLRLALRGRPGFEVNDLELRRTGPSYTIDTVRALPAELGLPEDVSIHLILGSDVLDGFAGWREARALLERVQPIVVYRAGSSGDAFEEHVAELERKLGPALASKVRAGYLRLPPVPASATEVRARLPGSAGELLDLPPEVLAYIRERGLYGAGT